MSRKDENREILAGEYQHLNFVSKFLRNNGIGAGVRDVYTNVKGYYSVLFVDAKDEVVASACAKAYIDEVNRTQSRKLRVAPIEKEAEQDSEDQFELLLG